MPESQLVYNMHMNFRSSFEILELFRVAKLPRQGISISLGKAPRQ